MKYNKGDLIAIRTLEDNRLSAVVVSVFNNNQFLYCYVLESGEYQLIYHQEVDFTIVEQFSPTFPPDKDFFNVDYSFYEACVEAYSFTPYFEFPFLPDDLDPYDDFDEDDE